MSISCHYIPSIKYSLKNQWWLTSKSIKALEIETSMVFNLAFANNTILSCFFLFS